MSRAEEWPYQQFLEALVRAEVFDASGARERIRHATVAAQNTLADFDWQAQPAAEQRLVMHLAQLAWIDEHADVCFLGPPGPGSHWPPRRGHLSNSPAPSPVAARRGGCPRRLRSVRLRTLQLPRLPYFREEGPPLTGRHQERSALMVNTRRLTVLEEPFSLDLPYADRQRIVVLPDDVASMERQKRAKARAELASRKRRDTRTPGQLAVVDDARNPRSSVNAEHDDVGPAFVEQLRIGAAEYEAAVLRGWGKLRDAGTGVREKIAAKASELAVRRRLGALLISRTEANMLRFDHGHPLEGVLYVRHPAQTATYFPAADFHRRVFEDKFVEAIKLLMSLGATRIVVQREEGFTREEAKIAVAPIGSRMKTGTEGGLSGALFEARLPGSREPTVPPDLCWYGDEPTWRMIAEARTASGAEGTSLSVTYQTDYGIDKQLIGTARGVGLGLGGQFQEQKNTVWRLDADFMPLADR